MAHLLLAVGQVVGLLLIGLGYPGVWVQLAALSGFAWWTEFATVGRIPLVVLAVLAVAVELGALLVSVGRNEVGARRRVGFAGLAGGGAGAVAGLPLPLLGSMFGALAGSFLGSLFGTFVGRRDRTEASARIGLLIATTLRTALGVAVAAFTLLLLFT